jgi:hypothetical protein
VRQRSGEPRRKMCGLNSQSDKLPKIAPFMAIEAPMKTIHRSLHDFERPQGLRLAWNQFKTKARGNVDKKPQCKNENI